MLNKLKGKFIAINMSIVAAMLIVIFGLVYYFTQTDLENQSMSMVRSLAQSVLQPDVPGEQTSVTLPYFTVQINSRGMVTVSGMIGYDLTDKAFVEEMLRIVYSSDKNSGMIKAYDLLYYRMSGIGSKSVAFVDISSQQDTLRTLVQSCILIGALSLAAFGFISFLLAKWAVRPVEKAWDQQRQFVSDASHELKTPLTVIMSNAELLQGEDCDAENRVQFSQNILTMSYQMRKLVEGLLELARADNGQVKKNFEALDLSVLAEDRLLPFEPLFYEQGMHLQSKIEPDVRVLGSSQYLGQVIDILLDNALKYGDPGIVSVCLSRQGRSCLLRVDNPGEPIPPEALERIFERFYRVDQARTRNGSFGLGLSIAKSVVDAHEGRIWAESNHTGNRFCVQLPMI